MERKKREGKGGNLYTYINVSWKIIIFNKEDLKIQSRMGCYS